MPLPDRKPEPSDEMSQSYKNVARDAERREEPQPTFNPFDQPPPTVARPPEVTVDAEIGALKDCVEALLPVAHDKAVLRRIYDYLQQRFPARPAGRRDEL